MIKNRRTTIAFVALFIGILIAGLSLQTIIAAAPILRLPSTPVNATYGDWLAGTNSTIDITLSNVGPGFDVSNGVYTGWCIQDYVNGGLNNGSVMLYSSFDPNMPADVKSLPWNKVNYVLNHKQGSVEDVQIAIWFLIGDPFPSTLGAVTPDAQAMIDAANANPTYEPQPGEIVAVIVYSDGMGTDPSTVQEVIIEVIVPVPGISIVKYTNGQVANDPNGADVPVVSPGDPVVWTYEVTNTGQTAVDQADVSVTDNQTGVTPAFDHEQTGNGDTTFDPGEVWIYSASGVAVDLSAPPAGVIVVEDACTMGETQPPATAYVNQGTATIPGASDMAPSSYCNPPIPNISIVKYTNGQVADDPNGTDVPVVSPGDPVVWTYEVTNTGQVAVAKADVSVTDNQTGVTPAYDHEQTGNGDATFDPGEVWIYTASGVAVDLTAPPAGVIVDENACTMGETQPPATAYVNQGTATIPGASDMAQSSYCNPRPGISIVKYTNGQVADDPNGTDVPFISPGDPVVWTYEVTNTGGVAVDQADVSVTDNQTGVTPAYDHEQTGNGDTTFDPGEVWIYTASGVAVDLSTHPDGVIVVENACTMGQTQPPGTAYVNQGTATIPGASDMAESSYCNPPGPGVSIVKYTNGQIANDPNGTDVPLVSSGDKVVWTYEVTNTGQVAVDQADVSVTDNQTGVTPVYDHEQTGNGDTTFDPGEVWIYSASGVAVDLSAPPSDVIVDENACTMGETQPPRTAYVNQGTATIPGATDMAQSSYCNPLYHLYFPIMLGNTPLSNVFNMSVGFEDLQLMQGFNDYDYNDWLVDIDGLADYDPLVSNGLRRMVWVFNPTARGAAYDHSFHLVIPSGTFGSDGTAVLTLEDQNHNTISQQTFAFSASTDTDFVIFPKTSDVFPKLANTYETQPHLSPQRYAMLDIIFTNVAPFNLLDYNLDSPHGEGLFFDPYLDVINTGDKIHVGDIRMLTVPANIYLQPEETIRIDKAYPDVGFTAGNPPTITFPTKWWENYNHCVLDGVICPQLTAKNLVPFLQTTPTAATP